MLLSNGLRLDLLGRIILDWLILIVYGVHIETWYLILEHNRAIWGSVNLYIVRNRAIIRLACESDGTAASRDGWIILKT